MIPSAPPPALCARHTRVDLGTRSPFVTPGVRAPHEVVVARGNVGPATQASGEGRDAEYAGVRGLSGVIGVLLKFGG